LPPEETPIVKLEKREAPQTSLEIQPEKIQKTEENQVKPMLQFNPALLAKYAKK